MFPLQLRSPFPRPLLRQLQYQLGKKVQVLANGGNWAIELPSELSVGKLEWLQSLLAPLYFPSTLLSLDKTFSKKQKTSPYAALTHVWCLLYIMAFSRLLCPKMGWAEFLYYLGFERGFSIITDTQDNFRTAAPCCVVMVLQVGQQISFKTVNF